MPKLTDPEEVKKFEKNLIDQVRAFPCLYDRLDPKFQDASIKNQMWKVVAAKCDNSVTQCKKQYMTLLNRFMNLHEAVVSQSITPQTAQKRFPHYNSLLYAKAFLQFDLSDNGPRNFGQQSINARFGPNGPNMKPMNPMNSNMPSLLGIRAPNLNPPLPFVMNNRYSSFGPSGMNMPSSSMGNNFSRPSQPNMNDVRSQLMQMNQGPRNQARSDDFGNDKDNSHIDFFFRSVSQQVKRAQLSGEDFLDLQGTILNILALKLPTYNN